MSIQNNRGWFYVQFCIMWLNVRYRMIERSAQGTLHSDQVGTTSGQHLLVNPGLWARSVAWKHEDNTIVCQYRVDRSALRIETLYRCDDRALQRSQYSDWPQAGRFLYIIQTGSEAHPTSYQMDKRGSFRGSKAVEVWNWPLTPN
jgi:hypothetical protein